MAVTIAGVSARDVRFPTSRGLHGSDAMNPDPYMAPQQAGYSAAMRPGSLDEHEFPSGAAWTS